MDEQSNFLTMKRPHKYTLLTLFLLTATACLPYMAGERAAFAIFNDTSKNISYQLDINSELSPSVEIAAGEFDYALEYDTENFIEGLPNEIGHAIIIVSGCSIELDRQEIIQYSNKDPEGRSIWDLHVNSKLFSDFECGE